MGKYENYKRNLTRQLVSAAGKTWKSGIWKRTGKEVAHILPLDGGASRSSRALAIQRYLHFDCRPWLPKDLIGLHQYAHHLNSSQLLCMMFFSQLIGAEGKATSKMVKFINDAFGIKIDEGAQCQFEYTECHAPYIFEVPRAEDISDTIREYEGTSFDFHISDAKTEIFFEIKLTEYGFGKAKNDMRHRMKAEQYIRLLPTLKKEVAIEDFLDYYQIFRNVCRAKNKNAHVIFITDGGNPRTELEKQCFDTQFGTPANVQFATWQSLTPIYTNCNCTLPFQLKALNQQPACI